jgi:hypothetical protein
MRTRECALVLPATQASGRDLSPYRHGRPAACVKRASMLAVCSATRTTPYLGEVTLGDGEGGWTPSCTGSTGGLSGGRSGHPGGRSPAG